MNPPKRLLLARQAYQENEWARANDAFAAADLESALSADDLVLFATTSHLLGRDDESSAAFDRAFHARANANDNAGAARCGFWLGLTLLLRGEFGAASGWLSRAQRQLVDMDCVESGYLLLPSAEQQLAAGHSEPAFETAGTAATIAARFDDADLLACAQHLQGRALIQQWQLPRGLSLLDEAMLAVTAGELSPIITGLIYCSVIETCQQSFALGRAREWTASLARWCDKQPDMVAFSATCRVRRAEVLQLSGAWPDAMDEALRASQSTRPPAAAYYQQAELHRLRGEHDAADAAYQRASHAGWEPQPGLSLLRMAQSQTQAAGALIRRVLSASGDQAQRARLLPCYVEVMLALGESVEAETACCELEKFSAQLSIDCLQAMAAHARGAIQLAAGDANAAIASLRLAWQIWEQVGVPYESARVRVLIGRACWALGDREGGQMELDAAKRVFQRLGAIPDRDAILGLATSPAPAAEHGLSSRELQVLRLVATGKTNKTIAAELCLSQKTIDRHVSNIFAKLDVPTRAAATAFAYEHNLL